MDHLSNWIGVNDTIPKVKLGLENRKKVDLKITKMVLEFGAFIFNNLNVKFMKSHGFGRAKGMNPYKLCNK